MAEPNAVRLVLADLRAETAELDALVGPLAPERWRTATPAAGWDIARQIAHLAWTDGKSLLAVADPEGFAADAKAAVDSGAIGTFVDDGAAEGAAVPPAELLAGWREGRERLWAALEAAPQGARFAWYGPPMGGAAMATARLMETWAHGLDVADALGVTRPATSRLRHVARLGVRTRDFAFAVRGLTPPPEEFRIELTVPDGPLWTYGPDDAAQRVTGPLLDFCLLATRRRHRDDLAVVASGDDADRWLDVVQAFAGPPGAGREPDGGAMGNGMADGGTAEGGAA